MSFHSTSGRSLDFLAIATAALGILALAGVSKADNFTLNSLSSANVNTQTLTSGVTYKVEVTGTYFFNANGQGDADYIFQNLPGYPVPTEDVHVYINNQSVTWLGTTDGVNFGAHTYSPSHVYDYYLSGQGSPAAIKLYDSLYSDNSGSLQVSVNPTPEPTSLAVLGVGAAGLLIRRRSRA